MSRVPKISEREQRAAITLATEARTVEELRLAQSIILPVVWDVGV